MPRRAGRVRRAAGGVPARAARGLARGGTRALPPRGEPRRSRGAVRVPRDLQHASHQAGQGTAPSARRGDPRIRGRGEPRQAPGPARARAGRGGAESPVARAGGFRRRVSAARPDARRRVPVPPRHPRLRGIGRRGAGARLVGGQAPAATAGAGHPRRARAGRGRHGRAARLRRPGDARRPDADRRGDRPRRLVLGRARADPGEVGGAGCGAPQRGARPLEARGGGGGRGRAQLHRGHASLVGRRGRLGRRAAPA